MRLAGRKVEVVWSEEEFVIGTVLEESERGLLLDGGYPGFQARFFPWFRIRGVNIYEEA